MYINKASCLLIAVSLCTLEGILKPVAGQHHESGMAGGMAGMDHHVQAPSTVMGFHSLAPGQIMMNYRFGMMKMGEAHQHLGQNHVTTQSVLRNYKITPVRMTTSMHMLGGMIGLPGNMAATFMLPVTSRSMDHNMATGGQFTTKSSGLGDLNIGMTSNRNTSQRTSLAYGISLTLPTGTINTRDVTPASSPNKMVLPYPMQLGSGSVEIKPETSASLQLGNLNLGTRISGTVRTGKNEAGYKLGNQLVSSVWVAFQPAASTEASITFGYNRWGNISGSDPRLQQQIGMVPSADPKLRRGSELLFTPEIIVSKNNTRLGSHGIIISGTLPLWHSLEGPQLGLAWSFGLGWRFSTN